MPLSEQDYADKDDNVLFRAIKVKNWSRVQELLTKEEQNEQTDESTPTTSNNNRNVPLTRQLDCHDNTALHAALGYAAPDEILLPLIQSFPHAAQVHGANDWLPLHVAVKWGCSRPVLTALILAHPAGLDDKAEGGVKGRTPRHFAGRFAHLTDLLVRSTESWRQEARQEEDNKHDQNNKEQEKKEESIVA